MTTKATPKLKRQITVRQRKLAQAVVENLGSGKIHSQKGLLRAVGYSEVQAQNPQQITQSVGFLAALAELGLTKELAVSSLVEDIKAKPQRRAFELSIAGKWLGLEKKEETQSSTTNIQNAVIMISPPTNGSVKPLKD